jgi:phosphatidyl-myo-inositol dimannoside synthase
MLLWLTRKFPPSIGGMERLNYELTRELANRIPLRLVSWGGRQRGLPVFLARAARAALIIRRQRIQLGGIHLGDALLIPFGVILSHLLDNIPVTVTAHGLDVTYPMPAYQLAIRRFLPRCALIICVSHATQDACVRRGASPTQCRVIPNGVWPSPHLCTTDSNLRQASRQTAGQRFGRHFGDGPVMLTVGRLVRRKGVAWFVREVLPALTRSHPNLTYLVVGQGPEAARISQAVVQAGVGSQTLLLGELSTDALAHAYAVADVFVMPNVPVRGNPEGFGIAPLDASVAGLWVVASRLDGIPDAVLDGENGILVPPEDARTWISQLQDVLSDPMRCRREGTRGREVTLNRFSWSSIVDQYLGEFAALGIVGQC